MNCRNKKRFTPCLVISVPILYKAHCPGYLSGRGRGRFFAHRDFMTRLHTKNPICLWIVKELSKLAFIDFFGQDEVARWIHE